MINCLLVTYNEKIIYLISHLSTNLALSDNFLEALINASLAASLGIHMSSKRTLHFLTAAV